MVIKQRLTRAAAALVLSSVLISLVPGGNLSEFATKSDACGSSNNTAAYIVGALVIGGGAYYLTTTKHTTDTGGSSTPATAPSTTATP